MTGYSKNERAAQLMGFRPENVVSFMEPAEVGYHCPVCKNAPRVDGEPDERLTWSEYYGFLWCSVCNRDYPCCLCLNDIEAAIDVFLDCVRDAVSYSRKGEDNV